MKDPFDLGRTIFAAAFAGLGAQCLVRGNVVPALEPMAATAALPVLGWVTGLVLIVAALAMLQRATAHFGAAIIAAMLLLWVALLHVPALAAAPRNGGEWTGAFESLALGGAALLLFGLTAREKLSRHWLTTRAAAAGRLMYGASMPAFGVLHFLYISYVAFVTPSWIPAHVFFAYATGVAHVASGVSILTGVLSRVAAWCSAAMFGSWVLIVHAPRVFRDPQTPSEWTSMFIAVGMCGGALLIASALSNISAASSSALDTTPFATRAAITT